MAARQQVSPRVVVWAFLLLVIVLGIVSWYYFAPPRPGPAVTPAGTTPRPGDPRAYPGGMPPGMQPGGPGSPSAPAGPR